MPSIKVKDLVAQLTTGPYDDRANIAQELTQRCTKAKTFHYARNCGAGGLTPLAALVGNG